MPGEKILIADSDISVNKYVCACLKKEQFSTICAYNARDALNLVRKEKPDLCILESVLSDRDGNELCLDIRKYSNVPVMFLSSKSREIDKIIAFSSGADDYVTKPFLPGELTARVRAHLRRVNMDNEDKEEIHNNFSKAGNLYIDFDSYECDINGKEIKLTSKEFDILKLLIENPGKVFNTKAIYEAVWKTKCMENDPKTVMVYISTLRKKIEPDPHTSKYIISVRGAGYKFNQMLFG